MKEKFVDIAFRRDTLAVIEAANKIIAEYEQAGFRLTLRQLYYQFVARGIIPNKQSEYKRLGSIIDSGRQAGLVDWSAIEDRTRNLKRSSAWESPEDILTVVANQYAEDLWGDQPEYVEVWIEKDALTGVIEPVCQHLRVPYFACRGYVSQSELYDAARRLRNIVRSGKRATVLHLGDHDPSGVHMSEDNQNRLNLFTRDAGVELRRIALTRDQIEQYSPPPNPAKDTDSRFAAYEEQYGSDSWELDALDPVTVANLIETETRKHLDDKIWAASVSREQENKAALADLILNWGFVKTCLVVRSTSTDAARPDVGDTFEDYATTLLDKTTKWDEDGESE